MPRVTVFVRGPADVNDAVQQQQPAALTILSCTEADQAPDGIAATARYAGRNCHGAAKFLGTGGHIQSVQALYLSTIFHGIANQIERVRQGIDHGCSRDPDLGINIGTRRPRDGGRPRRRAVR